MTHSTTSVGRGLAYIEQGSGPGLLLLHGNGGSTLRYRLCLPALGRRLRAVAVDLPGFGASRHLPATHYSLRDFGEAVAAFSAVHFTQPPILLGHGIGGVVAVEAVLADPAAFGGLVLHAPVGARLDQRLFPKIFGFWPTNEALRRLIAAPALRRLWARRFFADPSRLPFALQAEFFAEYGRCRAFYRFFQLLDARWFAQVGRLALPTLVLWGARDRALGVAQLGDWVRAIPTAQSAIVPHWDHFPMLEAPDEYGQRLADLVMRLRNAPDSRLDTRVMHP